MVAAEIPAPCRARPATREFWLRPATNRSVASIARKPLEKAPLPIAFGGPGAVTDRGPRALAGPPVPAAAVHEQPDHDLPVQLLHDMVPEPGERLAAVRAAVPAALEVPGHLDLRQVAVVTPPGLGPRPPLPPALAVPGLPALAATTRRRRLRPRPLRRPAERHRCRTARSARARSSSASRAASSAIRRLSCSFASSAAASTSRSGASPASPSAATPAATVTTTANTLSSTETPATPNLSRNRNPGTRPRPITVPGHVWRHQIRAPGRPVARFGQGSCHSPRVARTALFGPAALGLRAGL